MLARRQSGYSGPDFAVVEETAGRAAGIVVPILESEDPLRRLVRHAVLDRSGYGADGLIGSELTGNPAAVTVPGKLGAYRDAPWPPHHPVNRQLSGHPQRARTTRQIHFLGRELIGIVAAVQERHVNEPAIVPE